MWIECEAVRLDVECHPCPGAAHTERLLHESRIVGWSVPCCVKEWPPPASALLNVRSIGQDRIFLIDVQPDDYDELKTER
jgi:hypothetical protein